MKAEKNKAEGNSVSWLFVCNQKETKVYIKMALFDMFYLKWNMYSDKPILKPMKEKSKYWKNSVKCEWNIVLWKQVMEIQLKKFSSWLLYMKWHLLSQKLVEKTK